MKTVPSDFSDVDNIHRKGRMVRKPVINRTACSSRRPAALICLAQTPLRRAAEE